MCVHVSEPEVFYGSESRATHFTRTCPWRIPKTRAKPRVCWSLIRLPRCGSSWSFWCIWLSSWLGWQGRADSAAWSPNLYWSGIRLLILNRGRKRAPNLRVADHPEPRKTGIEREDGLGDQDDRTQHRAGLIHRRRQPRRDYEMAGYLTAVRLAERLGAREGVALLQKSRSEEQAAEQTLRKIATGLTNSAAAQAKNPNPRGPLVSFPGASFSGAYPSAIRASTGCGVDQRFKGSDRLLAQQSEGTYSSIRTHWDPGSCK
jgi:Domain of unknown function (DUF892)